MAISAPKPPNPIYKLADNPLKQLLLKELRCKVTDLSLQLDRSQQQGKISSGHFSTTRIENESLELMLKR